MRIRPAVPAVLVVLLTGCGYRVSGRGDLLPKTIHTIAIPAFANATTRYKLSEELPGAITREFLSRTRYRVIEDPAAADAVLEGKVLEFTSAPTIFDPATSRASAAQLSVFMDLELRERATGAVLFSRTRMEFKERYEISVDPRSYFDESGPALDRLSRDVARTVVSAILEKF